MKVSPSSKMSKSGFRRTQNSIRDKNAATRMATDSKGTIVLLSSGRLAVPCASSRVADAGARATKVEIVNPLSS